MRTFEAYVHSGGVTIQVGSFLILRLRFMFIKYILFFQLFIIIDCIIILII